MKRTDRIEQDILELAYRYTTVNFEYGEVITLLMKGPNTREKKKFKIKNGKSYDLYELIVKSIAENPPVMKLTFEDIRDRIYQLIPDNENKPTPHSIKENLNKLQELIDDKEDIFKVLDWKEGTLYIVDPLFLFYLRWGGKLFGE